jgi:hypothetical protein
MRAIFVSYRRNDSEGEAGRLFDDLVAVFGENSVFMDVAAIEVGRDFRKAIDDSVATCGVLLAIIGREWIDARNEAGQRRLDDPSDFVRLETASALRRDIPVVPVLVQGAKMPRPEQLPDDLKELSYRNGVELTHVRWKSDLQLLIKALSPHVEDSKSVTGQPADAARAEAARKSPIVPETRVWEVEPQASTFPKKRLATILAVVVAAIVAIVVAASLAIPKHVVVPDLSGNTVSEATAKLEALHLAVGTKTVRDAPTKDPDTVLNQSPSPNTRVKTGSTVDLILSQSSMVEIPRLVGMSLDDARRTLADRQLQVGNIDREPKAGVAHDTVLQQFPDAGERAKDGSKVGLMVADVPENASAKSGSGGRASQSEKAPVSNNITQAASQSKTTEDANQTPADVANSSEQVVYIAGTWHDINGMTFEIVQRGDTFTYTASSQAGMSRGSGTIRGTEFVSAYNTVLVNGLRSTGRCTGRISRTLLTATCLDSATGQSYDVLSR